VSEIERLRLDLADPFSAIPRMHPLERPARPHVTGLQIFVKLPGFTLVISQRRAERKCECAHASEVDPPRGSASPSASRRSDQYFFRRSAVARSGSLVCWTATELLSLLFAANPTAMMLPSVQSG